MYNNNRFKNTALILFFAALVSANMFISQNAYGITADEIVKNVQNIYDNASDYTAAFYQESELGAIKRVQKATGRVYFKKNGRMYWEYLQPMQQKVISNGTKMWIYQPDMNQVQVFDYSGIDMSRTANSFLNGIGKLMNDFDISFTGEEIEGNLVLDMTPKESGIGFKSMRMFVGKESYNIVRTVTVDAYGNKNSVAFKDIRFDVGTPDDFFDFKIPDGAIVVTPPAGR